MESIPSLVQDLALILVTAGVVTLIFKKLKQAAACAWIYHGGIHCVAKLPAHCLRRRS